MMRPQHHYGDAEPPADASDLPYSEVARMDLKLHRRKFGTRRCRSCRDPWPCPRYREVSGLLQRPGSRGWWLSVPVLAGLLVIASTTAGACPW